MALPKLNETPMYEMTVPSTGQKIRYRPYLVKEEKVLMMAYESQDVKSTLKAVVDTMKSCVDQGTDVDFDRLTSFDIEYMFIKLRSKSVGEVSNISIRCPDEDCKHKTEVQIDLETIEVTKPKNSNVIKLTDDIYIEMSYPSYKSLVESDLSKEGSNPDIAIETIARCIVSVMQNQERVSVKDEPLSEIKNFLESMTTEQFTKINTFFEEMPRLNKELEYTCEKCGHNETINLRNMEDFF